MTQVAFLASTSIPWLNLMSKQLINIFFSERVISLWLFWSAQPLNAPWVAVNPPVRCPCLPVQVHESAWGMLCLYCNCIKGGGKDGLITLSKWPVHLEKRVKQVIMAHLPGHCEGTVAERLALVPASDRFRGFHWLKGGFASVAFMGPWLGESICQ